MHVITPLPNPQMKNQTKGKPPEDVWRLGQVFLQFLGSLELIYLNVSDFSNSSNLKYTLPCPEILIPVTGHATIGSISPFTCRWQHEQHLGVRGCDSRKGNLEVEDENRVTYRNKIS